MPLTTYDPSLESRGDRPAMANKADFAAYTTAISELMALIQRYIDAVGYHDDCRCSFENCPDVDSITATMSGFEQCNGVPIGLGKYANLPWDSFNGDKSLVRTFANQWRFDDTFIIPVYSDAGCTVIDSGLSPITVPVYVTCNCYASSGFGITVGTSGSDNPSLYGSGGAIWQSDTLTGPVFVNGNNVLDGCPFAGGAGAAIITMEASFDSEDFADLVAAVNALAPVGVPTIIWMRYRHPKKEALYPS